MIEINLSERDFDYEIQALVNSFFPGQRSVVVICGEERSEYEFADDILLTVNISLSMKQIAVEVICGDYDLKKMEEVTGEKDWHKNKDKTTHPYRTYYKNVLKKLIFEQLRDIPAEKLNDISDGHLLKRVIPLWGTMTGVRPAKIAMNELLSGKMEDEVRKELRDTYCCSEEKIELGLEIAKKEAEILEKCDYKTGYSLYIGIPFCPTTCLYCSFTSYPYEKFGHLAEKYLDALEREIKYLATIYKDRNLTSIYVGGGTPTTLTAMQLDRLISCIKENFPMELGYEFTIEAGRPDSITREKLEVMYNHGVRRISVNPQTMQQKTLDLIGRKHTVEQTIEAFRLARHVGFDNINMDLIIGLPGENEDDFRDTLHRIKELNPDSLTIHSLVVKRASRLRSVLDEEEKKNSGKADGILSENDKAAVMEKMLDIGQKFAKSEGYEPYYMYRQKNSTGHFGSSGQENIGYARKGKECIYNILIMEEKQGILAAGAGASTKKMLADEKVKRCENVKDITSYISRVDEMIERKRQLFSEE